MDIGLGDDCVVVGRLESCAAEYHPAGGARGDGVDGDGVLVLARDLREGDGVEMENARDP